ncbi:MAG: methyltransferase domain-containing protein [Gemmatimonadota bacterium]|nr:methyltransferase domain-containing protein [Gemmatimonadota bacterium]|tara:strand:+ start:529 stop:1191 length:663 start_codon:yes stop_codon:yes gene_type:complete
MLTNNSGPLVVVLLAGIWALVAGPVSAQLGGRPAEEWAITLESGRRLASLEIQEVVDRMNLEPGEVVADIGAGTGVFSVPMARAVGASGRVISVEVDPGFLPMILAKAALEDVNNISAVLGGFLDPRLPRDDVDVAFFHDVLHHVDDRQAYLTEVAKYMGPGSRMIVVDYNMNVEGVPHSNQPEMLISPEQVAGWMSGIGFEVSREIEMFDDKFFVVYSN